MKLPSFKSLGWLVIGAFLTVGLTASAAPSIFQVFQGGTGIVAGANQISFSPAPATTPAFNFWQFFDF